MLKSTQQGTFLVQVLDQQHSSWQGTITWLATNEKKTFRSLLEFITLVGTVLEGSKNDEEQLTDEAGKEAERVAQQTNSNRTKRKSAASTLKELPTLVELKSTG